MSKWEKMKRTLGVLGILGTLTLAMLPTQAETRGRVYIERNSFGAVEKYLSIYETAGPTDVVELEYEPIGEGNGAPYIIKATGYFNSDSLVILHGEKQGPPDEAFSQDFAYAQYPVKEAQGIGNLILTSNGHYPLADKLLENSVPGTYRYFDTGVLLPSEYAMRMLLNQVSYELSGIEAVILDSDPQYSQYTYQFHANLHEAYPEIADTGYGRTIDVTAGGTPNQKHLNTFVVDGKMENIWRVNSDGTLFQVYGLDGVG